MWRRRDNDEEDPFASLREGTAGATSTRPRVADHTTISGVPGAEDEPATDRRPGSKAPKRRRGSDVLLVLLLIFVSLGAGAALIVREERAASDTPRAQGDPAPGDQADPAGPRGDDADPPPPRRYDLVRPQGMRLALRTLRRTMGPREMLDSLRVESSRINTIVHSPQSERQRMINIADDLAVDVTASGQRAGGGMRLAQVDPAAPSRALSRAARAGGFSPRKLDYMVLSAPIIPGSRPTWSLFFDGVRLRNNHWAATLDGRVAYRPGEQPAEAPGRDTTTSSLTVRRNGETTTYSGADAARISRCIRNAGSDGAAIQRCLP